MVNALSPEYLVVLVPPTVGSFTPYPLRNATNIQTIHSASQSYYNSFLPSVIRENDLSEEVRNSVTISTFKCKLDSNIKSPLKFYFRRTRIGHIYHARLRTNCSSLNQHLFSNNIDNSPLCTCGAIEDTQHFLFVCNRYNDLRRELFDSVSVIRQPSLNLFLEMQNLLQIKIK